MYLVWLAALTAVCSAEKLGRGYLPPAFAKTVENGLSLSSTPFPDYYRGPAGSYSNDVQGIVVDAASPGTRTSIGTEESGLGAPRTSYGSTASKVGEAAFKDSLTGFNKSPTLFKSIPLEDQDPEYQTSIPKQEAIQTKLLLPQDNDHKSDIVTYENNVDIQKYNYGFESDNGIAVGEKGVAHDGVHSQGDYSYKGDDGKVYKVTYTVNKAGHQPQGEHLPTPYPAPENIQKAIEKNKKEEADVAVVSGSNDSQKYNAEGDYKESDTNKYQTQQSQFEKRPEYDAPLVEYNGPTSGLTSNSGSTSGSSVYQPTTAFPAVSSTVFNSQSKPSIANDQALLGNSPSFSQFLQGSPLKLPTQPTFFGTQFTQQGLKPQFGSTILPPFGQLSTTQPGQLESKYNTQTFHKPELNFASGETSSQHIKDTQVFSSIPKGDQYSQGHKDSQLNTYLVSSGAPSPSKPTILEQNLNSKPFGSSLESASSSFGQEGQTASLGNAYLPPSPNKGYEKPVYSVPPQQTSISTTPITSTKNPALISVSTNPQDNQLNLQTSFVSSSVTPSGPKPTLGFQTPQVSNIYQQPSNIQPTTATQTTNNKFPSSQGQVSLNQINQEYPHQSGSQDPQQQKPFIESQYPSSNSILSTQTAYNQSPSGSTPTIAQASQFDNQFNKTPVKTQTYSPTSPSLTTSYSVSYKPVSASPTTASQLITEKDKFTQSTTAEHKFQSESRPSITQNVISTQLPLSSQQVQGVDHSYYYNQPAKPFSTPATSSQVSSFPLSSSSQNIESNQYSKPSQPSDTSVSQEAPAQFPSQTLTLPTSFPQKPTQQSFSQSTIVQKPTTSEVSQLGQTSLITSPVSNKPFVSYTPQPNPTQQYTGELYDYKKPTQGLSATTNKDSSTSEQKPKDGQIQSGGTLTQELQQSHKETAPQLELTKPQVGQTPLPQQENAHSSNTPATSQEQSKPVYTQFGAQSYKPFGSTTQFSSQPYKPFTTATQFGTQPFKPYGSTTSFGTQSYKPFGTSTQFGSQPVKTSASSFQFSRQPTKPFGSTSYFGTQQAKPSGSNVQFGTQQSKPSEGSYLIGIQQVKPSGSNFQFGTQQAKPSGSTSQFGIQKAKPSESAFQFGTQQAKPSGGSYLIGTQQAKPSGGSYLIGTQQAKPSGGSFLIGTQQVKPSESTLQLGTQQAKPSGGSFQINTQQAKPSESTLQLGTQQAKPSGGSFLINTQQAKPSESTLQLGTQQAKPSESTLQLGTQQAKPSGDLFLIGTQQAKPSESVLPLGTQQAKPSGSNFQFGTQQAKPSGNTFQFGLQQAKPSESTSQFGIQKAKPSESAFQFGTQQAKPSGGSYLIGTQQAKPSESLSQLGTLQAKPPGGSFLIGTQQVKPSESTLQLGTQQAKPSEGSFLINTQQAKPSESTLQLGTQQAKPSESTLQLGTQQTKPSAGLFLIGTQQAKPSESVLPLGTQQAKPSGNTFQFGLQQAKPSESTSQFGIQTAKPSESAFQFGTQQAKPSEGSYLIGTQQAKPSESLSQLGTLQAKPPGGSFLINTQQAKPSESTLQLGTQQAKPSGGSFLIGTQQVKPSESTLQLGTQQAKPSGGSFLINTQQAKPSESTLQLGTQQAKPSESTLQLGTQQAKPSGDLFLIGTQQAKPSENTLQSGTQQAKPSGGSFLISTQQAKPSESILQLGSKQAKPSEGSSQIGTQETKPCDSDLLFGTPSYKPQVSQPQQLPQEKPQPDTVISTQSGSQPVKPTSNIPLTTTSQTQIGGHTTKPQFVPQGQKYNAGTVSTSQFGTQPQVSQPTFSTLLTSSQQLQSSEKQQGVVQPVKPLTSQTGEQKPIQQQLSIQSKPQFSQTYLTTPKKPQQSVPQTQFVTSTYKPFVVVPSSSSGSLLTQTQSGTQATKPYETPEKGGNINTGSFNGFSSGPTVQGTVPTTNSQGSKTQFSGESYNPVKVTQTQQQQTTNYQFGVQSKPQFPLSQQISSNAPQNPYVNNAFGSQSYNAFESSTPYNFGAQQTKDQFGQNNFPNFGGAHATASASSQSFPGPQFGSQPFYNAFKSQLGQNFPPPQSTAFASATSGPRPYEYNKPTPQPFIKFNGQPGQYFGGVPTPVFPSVQPQFVQSTTPSYTQKLSSFESAQGSSTFGQSPYPQFNSQTIKPPSATQVGVIPQALPSKPQSSLGAACCKATQSAPTNQDALYGSNATPTIQSTIHGQAPQTLTIQGQLNPVERPIQGENFDGPKQPQRFDEKTGYHY